jgi:hypothetical protein
VSVESFESVATMIERGIETIERGEAQTFSLVGLEREEIAFALMVAQNVLAERWLPADVRPRRNGIDVIPWLA